ncbi:MAG TPA: hypothetical protein VEA60_06670 [Allosphingosinicella sp.]|nr:hypothetical protein [Allosphingosinicella sp.]
MKAGAAVAALGAFFISPAAAEPPDSLSIEASSWGKPLFDWTANRSGLSSYTESRDAPSGKFHDYDLVTRVFRVSKADYRRLAALVAPARRHAGGSMKCDERATDLPYGRIIWKTGTGTIQLPFDLGCRSAQTAQVHAGLQAAQDLMERLAARAPIVTVREIREGRR